MCTIGFMDAVTDFVKILTLKRYSNNTITSYKSHVLYAKQFFYPTPLKQVTDKALFQMVYFMVQHKNISASYQRQLIGALKLFYKEVFNRNVPFEYVQVTQRERNLPKVLSKQEVKQIINNTNNLKHEALLSIIYSAGLRIGEALALQLSDIDSDRMLIHIRRAKGKKDRYTLLSVKALKVLRLYYKAYKPKVYLFEGQKGGKYTAESALKVLKRAAKASGINKTVTLHTLRHSFATHLLEDGIGIAHIQKLLGHSKITTTLIYTHIAKDALGVIKSPLD